MTAQRPKVKSILSMGDLRKVQLEIQPVRHEKIMVCVYLHIVDRYTTHTHTHIYILIFSNMTKILHISKEKTPIT